MEITPRILHQVQLDNMHTHQFADSVDDGVDWEVAKEMGFSTPEDVQELIATHGITEPEVTRSAKNMPTRSPKKVRPHPGPIPGESEGEVTPAGHELYVPLTPTEKEIGKKTLKLLRESRNN